MTAVRNDRALEALLLDYIAHRPPPLPVIKGVARVCAHCELPREGLCRHHVCARCHVERQCIGCGQRSMTAGGAQ